MQKQALIVLRHADDLASNWIPTPGSSFMLPTGQVVPVPQRALTAAGEDRARLLSTVIPVWLDQCNYEPVTRVVVRDPSSVSETPNPFDTIYPFIVFNGILDVQLVVGPLTDPARWLSTFGSTIICWDCEGMWGPKTNGVRPTAPVAGSILDHLSSVKLTGDEYPQKAETLYAFTDQASTGKFNLAISLVSEILTKE